MALQRAASQRNQHVDKVVPLESDSALFPPHALRKSLSITLCLPLYLLVNISQLVSPLIFSK